MAIVVDKSGNSTASLLPTQKDVSFCTPLRTVAGSPNVIGPLVPLYAGERVWDSTNFAMYEAWGVASTNWQVVTDTEKAGA